MQIDHLPSVAELPSATDRLFGDVPIYCTREWLHFCEYHDYSEPNHLVAAGDDGWILGLLPAFDITYEGNPRYRPNDVLGDTLPEPLRTSEAWFPGVVLGARAGNGNTLLLNDALDAASRTDVLAELIRTARERAQGTGARGMWMMYLSAQQAGDVLAAWPEADAHVGLEVDLVIPIPGTSFDDYAAAMTKKRRAKVRRERHAFHESRPDLDHVDFDDEACGLIAPLLGKMQAKHGMPRTTEWLADRLRHQAADLGRHGSVLLLRRDGRLVAFSLLFRHRDQSIAASVGVDYSSAAPFDYFNIAFYEPLRIAQARGDRSLAVGLSASEAKMLRGAVPRPIWHVVEAFGAGAGAATHPEVERRNAERLATLEAWCAHYAPGPLDPAGWAMPVPGRLGCPG